MNTNSRQRVTSISNVSLNSTMASCLSPVDKDKRTLHEVKLLKDTLDLLWNKTLEQRELYNRMEQENNYLQEYINSFMSSSNVLDK